ncbi:hypothetical protein SEA_WEASELS2_121 [Rhodococcus phage Weasels2]|uniref:Uncharacterized protein n=1 Tax=Rhodococcus phage Weasels2 TaxID=1897437 RepID=A0A1I9SAA4_9CAUD|nr:hypothetical protein FDH04_gp121 [Rhodococcus phage Weasels2]AOZ63710.1 hypothetical protein SEA_WEASELS2_121 [Rhodococcus phage Weasels2]
MLVYLTGRAEFIEVDADSHVINADKVLVLYKGDERVASFSNWDGVVKV